MKRMGSGAAVVCVGHDKLLLQTRALVLGTYFHVEMAATLKSLAALAERHTYALVVLCQTLSWEERFLATEMVHKMWPEARVLEVSSAVYTVSAGENNEVIVGLDGPAVLLEAAGRLLDMPAVQSIPPPDRVSRHAG